jgi:hypothetical protein
MHAQYEAQFAPGACGCPHVTEHVMVAGLHAPDAQSLCATQPCPEAHWVGQVPPQSTSVSDPFLTPSLQLGATHVCEFSAHTMLAHWLLCVHSTHVPAPSQ